MALKTFNPTSPSRRNLVQVDRSDLHKGQAREITNRRFIKKGW